MQTESENKVIVIIGHRGVGKSELARRLQHYDHNADFVDLDDEIEKKINKRITEIFIDHGEAYFRNLEKQVCLEIFQKVQRTTYICTGAGLELDLIPASAHVLWVRRNTDSEGRIFLDRPRLDAAIKPLEEFQKRYAIREPSYRNKYTQIYDLPEGDFQQKFLAQDIEKKLLSGHQNSNAKASIGGGLTLMPEFFQSQRWGFLQKYFLYLNPTFFELRNDLLSAEQMSMAAEIFTAAKCLFSFRRENTKEQQSFFEQNKKHLWAVDWDYELGFWPQDFEQLPLILSCHNLDWDFMNKVPSNVKWIKFAPLVQNFTDLKKAHDWSLKNPQQNQFLPRSLNGRWLWYRLLKKNINAINFWKYGEGSALDQPSLFEWMVVPTDFKNFAAILGDPVAHSWTPLEQSDFFNQRQSPVFKIQIHKEEFAEAFPVVQAMGLQWAAVTAPLKQSLFPNKSINTLSWLNGEWHSTSTDEQGFADLLEGLESVAPLQSQIAVWGGGGTLDIMKKVIPKAYFFSARSGDLKFDAGQVPQDYNPVVVVWAAGSGPSIQWPAEDWTPRVVVDLSYKEDSTAREYALKKGAMYISGKKMFTSQAQEQRKFWKNVETGVFV